MLNEQSSCASASRVDEAARLIREESLALIRALPPALDRQWSPSPAPRPYEDTSQRTTGDRPSDPTGDTVLDPRRLAVRESVTNAERMLARAVVGLRLARLQVEKAVARFDGDDQ